MANQIRAVTVDDLDAVVALSEKKRIQYQSYQPLFWRKAVDSAAKQKPFLENLITQEHILALAHISPQGGADRIDGFVIADIGSGDKCSIDDFAIANEAHWDSVGKSLLLEVGQMAKERTIAEYEVVCGHLDQPKRFMLHHAGLEVERYWYTKAIEEIDGPNNQVQVRPGTADDAVVIAKLLDRSSLQVPEVDNEHMTVLVGVIDDQIHGCLMGLVVPAPPVYDPGGDTCLVTELAILESNNQQDVCQALLLAFGRNASQQGAVQYVVMCDSQDHLTQTVLSDFGMTIASEWYQGKI